MPVDFSKLTDEGLTTMARAGLTVAQLKAMPTLHSGQFDNLKMQSATRRVWLTRLTAADGHHGPSIIYECLDNGRWVTCGTDGRPEMECA